MHRNEWAVASWAGSIGVIEAGRAENDVKQRLRYVSPSE